MSGRTIGPNLESDGVEMAPTTTEYREPSSASEAQAVVATIRAEKAIVDEVTLEDIAAMPDIDRREDCMRGMTEAKDVKQYVSRRPKSIPRMLENWRINAVAV